MIRAFILGASGYGGGELFRLLSGHSEVEAIKGSSRQHAGKPVHAVHPNLRGIVDAPFEAEFDLDWFSDCESPTLFAAMPHGEFAKIFASLRTELKSKNLYDRLTIIDLSADFRLSRAADYDTFYGSPHPCPEFLPDFEYGLPELSKFNGRRIANPGCFATACQLALAPIARVGHSGFVSIVGATGSSGSGMTPSETTHHPTRAHDFRAYKPLAHQHEAEIYQYLQRVESPIDVAFVPHSAPMVRGIFVSATFQASSSLTPAKLQESVRETYRNAPFVRVVESSPRVAAVNGSNFAEVSSAVNRGSATVLVAIDNLMKGMAGTAVQNMNLAHSLPETTGLWFPPAYPG